MKRAVAIYLRLSDEDKKTGKSESESIANQRAYLLDYIGKEKSLLTAQVREYCDDGYTGVSFRRPGFSAMLADMKRGEIGCVLVKDLSRLGRNYIEAGDYLEEVFPNFNVRFISINDGYDSRGTNAAAAGFQNLYYSFYSQDLSEKIRKGKELSAQKGYYSGSFPPYGYQKGKEDSHRLVPDENTAPVVRRIFQLRAEGMSGRMIALQLNKDKVPPPMAYFKGERGTEDKKLCWNATSILRIVQNQCYLGHTVRQKTSRSTVRGKREENKKGILITENTHAPIISVELFEKVNAERLRRGKYEKREDALFRGKLFCHTCKKTLSYKIKKSGVYYYCRTEQVVAEKNCDVGEVEEKGFLFALSAVTAIWRQIFFEGGAGKKTVKNEKKQADSTALSRTKTELALRLCRGNISKEEYNKRIVQTEKMRFLKESAENKKTSGKQTEKGRDDSFLREILVYAEIHTEKRMELRFSFCDPF